MEQPQDRRCVAQQGPTVGVVKLGGGMSMWERSLLPSDKLSRHGRLVKALEHHILQPNALPNVQCIMLAKKLTRYTRIYRLANQLRKENADVVGDKPVKNDAGEMSMNDDSKVEGLVRALPKASQC